MKLKKQRLLQERKQMKNNKTIIAKTPSGPEPPTPQPNPFPYTFRFQKCGQCGREFLVERVLFGIDHTMQTNVTCKECLQKKPLPEKFIAQHPSEAKAIQNWLVNCVDKDGGKK